MMDKSTYTKLNSVLIFSLLITMSVTAVFLFTEDNSAENVFFMEGNGTENDPYVIENVYDLQNISKDLSAHYVLGNDIDAGETSSWNLTEGVYKGFKPIGTFTDRFEGSFDGKGHEIKDLYINRNSTIRVGLFGYVDEDHVIKNVKLINVDIKGDNYVGALVAYNYRAHVINSSVTGSINGEKYVGGVIGMNYGFINDCVADVSVSGSERVGGLIGNNGRFVNECSTEGTVTSSSHYCGGLIGFNSGTIKNSNSRSDVGSESHSGGLVGYNDERITKCWATGSVEGDMYTAGLVGYNMNTGDISACYASGDVSGNKTVGGLIGMNYNYVENCYATGDVTGSENVGGLVGWVDDVDQINGGIVKRCYSTGTVSGDKDVGGLVGNNSHEVLYSFWDKQTSGQQSSDGGTGMTTEEMKTREIYFDEGWDFSALWNIIPETSYPFFRYRYSPPSIIISGENEVYEDSQYTASIEYKISSYPDQNGLEHKNIISNADWLTYDEGNNEFTGTPSNEHVGLYKIEVTVEDSISESDLTHFIEVKNVNDAPDISTSDVTEIVEGKTYSVQYNAVDIDPKVTTLNWNLDTDAGWLEISDDGLLSGIPRWSEVGSYWVNVSVSDDEGAEDYSNFTLDVLALNDLSEIEIQGDHNAMEDEPYSISYSVSDPNSTSGSLTWTINTTADWLEVDTDSQVIEGTPRNKDVGEYIINLKVENNEGFVVSRQFAVNVLNTNDEPEWIYVPPDQEILEDTQFNIGCIAKDVDPEDHLKYSISSDISSGIEIDPVTGELDWQNTEKGTYDLTVKASDSESSINHEFTVKVIEHSTDDQSSTGDDDTDSTDDSETSEISDDSLYLPVIAILSVLLIISTAAAIFFKKKTSENESIDEETTDDRKEELEPEERNEFDNFGNNIEDDERDYEN